MMEASSTVALPTSWRAAAERSTEERSMLVRLVSIDKGPTWLSGLNMVAVWTDMIVGSGRTEPIESVGTGEWHLSGLPSLACGCVCGCR